MGAFAVHPGAVEPYERLTPEEMSRLLPLLGPPPAIATSYLRLARPVPRVLEYGAGRGSLTWAIARAGTRVTAVDLSERLLGELVDAGAHQPRVVARRVKALHGDMRSLRLKTRFPLVIAPGSTFLHLYSRADVEAFLGLVCHHMTPDGRFVFDVALPDPLELEGDYDPVAQVLFRELKPGVLLAQRQVFPRELRMLLWYNGLRVMRMRLAEPCAPNRRGQLLVVTACKRSAGVGI